MRPNTPEIAACGQEWGTIRPCSWGENTSHRCIQPATAHREGKPKMHRCNCDEFLLMPYIEVKSPLL